MPGSDLPGEAIQAMPNPKTASSGLPYPEPENGWVHKCDVDEYLGRNVPIPGQVISNEEYPPLPQTQQQRTVEHHLLGDFFQVEAAETYEPAPAEDRTKFFIFDIQTHHVAAGRDIPALLGYRRAGGLWNPDLKKKPPQMDDLYLENYIKEVFLDSETDMVGQHLRDDGDHASDVVLPGAWNDL